MTSSSSITVGLSELRQAYTKRLVAVTAARTKWLSGGGRASDSDVSGLGLGPGDLAIDVNCFAGMLPHPQQSSSPQRSGDCMLQVSPQQSGDCKLQVDPSLTVGQSNRTT